MNFESGYLRKKWSVGLKILPLLGGIIALKLLLHFLEWEVLSLNPLFTSIVAATTFLLGFLITGVLADYKQSEKIHGDMAASLLSISDEAICIQKSKRCSEANGLLQHMSGLSGHIINWFHKKVNIGTGTQYPHINTLVLTKVSLAGHFSRKNK